MTNISLSNAAKYYKGLAHQNKAWDYLTSLLTIPELEKFASLYRTSSVPTSNLMSLTILSQRDYGNGDLDKDGKPDWYQTCNVHSVAAVLSYMLKRQIMPREVDNWIRDNKGSRYSHASLASALHYYGVNSIFSTSTSLEKINESLLKGIPVIWSNKLTKGGHIVVLCGVNMEEGYYVVADPYGEPFGSPGNWKYKPSPNKYKLSFESFKNSGMNGIGASGHWSHILSLTSSPP